MLRNEPYLVLWAGLILATPAIAAKSPEGRLEKALAGKTAGTPVDCIRPDLSARPEIYSGIGILYRDARTTYLARMEGACPALRDDRTIIVRGDGQKLCRHDPVRIVEPTGADFGFCTFSGFTPYAK
jgi:hypothetical protein